MNLIFDATALKTYPVGRSGFSGGSELMVHKICEGLAALGHTVHVVTPDLTSMEQRKPTLFYWPPHFHPDAADAVVMVSNLENIDPYSAETLILASNGMGADLGPDDNFVTGIDGVACFTDMHATLLSQEHPKLDPDKCFVTGLGVDTSPYDGWEERKVPARFLYANAPERGLLNTLKIFALVQKRIDHATLHITYNWLQVFEQLKWISSALTEELWECKALIDTLPNVTYLGQLDRGDIQKEQMECQLHMYPSSPPNVGSQIHGLTQLECAAAGCGLMLSDVEAFPELFGNCADILFLPGYYDPEAGRRWDVNDWAEIAVETLQTPAMIQSLSHRARAMAETQSWESVTVKWDAMLYMLASGKS